MTYKIRIIPGLFPGSTHNLFEVRTVKDDKFVSGGQLPIEPLDATIKYLRQQYEDASIEIGAVNWIKL